MSANILFVYQPVRSNDKSLLLALKARTFLTRAAFPLQFVNGTGVEPSPLSHSGV